MVERIGGIISGLDTRGLITKLMQLEARPMENLKKQQHTYELRKELWQEINTSLSSLNTQINNLLKPDNLTLRKVSASDETVVKATADTTAVAGVYDLTVNFLAQAHRVAGSRQSSSTTALGLNGTFTIGDGTYTSTITVNTTDTLTSIVNKINAAKDNADPTKDLQVTATIVDNTLVLTHDKTGAANTIILNDGTNTPGSTTTDEILESLGILNDSKAIANQLQAPRDASFTVNGISITRNSNTITDAIQGVTLNLLKDGGATSRLTVAIDTDKIVANIKAFVDQYNTTLDLINTRLSEEKVEGATSDTALRKGLLRGDTALAGLKDSLRRLVSEPINGLSPFDRLSDIGITTTADDFGKSGKLVIDETKLTSALQQDAQGVAKLFFNDLDGDRIVDSNETGVAVKLSREVEQWISTQGKTINGVTVKTGLIPGRLDSLDKIINDYNEKIEDFQRRLDLREQALWEQFTAMEKALSAMQNQAAWLAGQLNVLNNNY